jgi:toxin CcdB
MRQFDIVRLKGGHLGVILQSDFLDDRETRVVAPLFPSSLIVPTPRLHPIVRVGRRNYLLATEKLTAVLLREVEAVIGSVDNREYEIRRALDIVFMGF